jgi:hypothetical protein
MQIMCRYDSMQSIYVFRLCPLSQGWELRLGLELGLFLLLHVIVTPITAFFVVKCKKEAFTFHSFHKLKISRLILTYFQDLQIQ